MLFDLVLPTTFQAFMCMSVSPIALEIVWSVCDGVGVSSVLCVVVSISQQRIVVGRMFFVLLSMVF